MYDDAEDNSWSFAAGLFVGALVGAGLASIYTPRSGTQNREMVREKSLVLKDRVSDVTTTATTRVSGAASSVTERAGTVASTVRDRTSSAVSTVQGAASSAASKVSDVASTTTEKVSGVAATTAAKVSDVASTATEKARELTGRTTDSAETATETVEQPRQPVVAVYQAPGSVEQSAQDADDIPVAPATAVTQEMRTTTIVGDTVITDSSAQATRRLASDEQFEANPPAQGSSPIVSSNIANSGEVPGASSSDNS